MGEPTEGAYRETDRVIAGVAEIASSRPLPWVTLAWAQTIDGSFAEHRGVRTALSGSESMRYTHYLRSRHAAILVGVGTVISDDPRLSTRLVAGRSPRVVVLDSLLRCPARARIFDTPRDAGPDGPVIAYVADRADAACDGRRRVLEERGATVIAVPGSFDGTVELSPLLTILRGEGISTVMVEGGARVLSSFFASGLVDYVAITIAMRLLQGYRLPGDRGGRASAWSTNIVDVHRFPLGEDLLLLGRPTFDFGVSKTR
ncbi:MAG: dihydrofolate reductase family protein [Spirochaetales bacterium]|nr:dihydrofolate reductase family protein [Spirochaetales bacterium]